MEELLTRVSAMVYRVALSHTGSVYDAEDVMQDVFVAYARRLPKFDGAEHEKAWFLRATLDRCKNFHASAWRKRTQALTADLPFTDEESQRDVWAAVLSLQDNFKSAVLLYYYMGYSVAELAKICGVSEPAAKKRLERARKKLKEILGDDYNDL